MSPCLCQLPEAACVPWFVASFSIFKAIIVVTSSLAMVPSFPDTSYKDTCDFISPICVISHLKMLILTAKSLLQYWEGVSSLPQRSRNRPIRIITEIYKVIFRHTSLHCVMDIQVETYNRWLDIASSLLSLSLTFYILSVRISVGSTFKQYIEYDHLYCYYLLSITYFLSIS